MIKVYLDKNNDYVCELWGGSTKHPDSVFNMKNFKKADFLDDKYQVYQWLLECASKLTFPCHARDLVDYANKHWYNW